MKNPIMPYAYYSTAKRLRQKKVTAFTLIEILIVVAIIGIILGIAVPALNTAREDTLATKVNAIKSQISTAKDRYYLKNPAIANTTELNYTDVAAYLRVNGIASPDETSVLYGTPYATITVGNDTIPVSLSTNIPAPTPAPTP